MYSLSYYLMTTHDNGFCAIVALKQALNKVAFVIRTPVGFFGVVRLHGMLAFHFNGNGKVGQWILIGTSGLLDVARHVGCLDFLQLFQERFWKLIWKKIKHCACFKTAKSRLLHWIMNNIAFQGILNKQNQILEIILRKKGLLIQMYHIW